jgi:predicted AAA+ superfamily ATPase
MITRILKLPAKNSFFLFGPRQTGKSTLINALFGKSAWNVDLLLNDTFIRYCANPSQFRIECETKIVEDGLSCIIIDEVQKLPELLSETHALMAKYPLVRFILTGSSARKLKRAGVDMLGGRAIECRLFPFVYSELKDQFNLEEALRWGTLPPIIGKDDETRTGILRAYVNTYLTQEIQAEGLSRNIGAFTRFLELAASECGEQVNFSALAREAGLSISTAQGHYDILEDTLVGIRLFPWRKSIRKRLAGHPKFYLFDTGVTNALCKRLTGGLDSSLRGKLFEQFVILETWRMLNYLNSEASLYFWRTNHGAEVDLLIEKHGTLVAAIEIKSSSTISGNMLSGLRSFSEDYPETPRFVVCMAPQPYSTDFVKVITWKNWFEMLPEIL